MLQLILLKTLIIVLQFNILLSTNTKDPKTIIEHGPAMFITNDVIHVGNKDGSYSLNMTVQSDLSKKA